MYPSSYYLLILLLPRFPLSHLDANGILVGFDRSLQGSEGRQGHSRSSGISFRQDSRFGRSLWKGSTDLGSLHVAQFASSFPDLARSEFVELDFENGLGSR